ncbi:MAG: metallophosphoesterase [Verrucomicrobiales bacterium]|nr:metallophosphoesterase [Verrucomicrobiales bacterium]
MRLLVVSDIHLAGDAERARFGWERRVIRNPLLREFAGLYRRWFWLADPTAHNHQLDAFLSAAGNTAPDLVIANGDYSCDSAFIGLADDAAFASARECLGKLRAAFGTRLLATLGDHELGKMSLFGGVGGPRWASWERCVHDLGFQPLWRHDTASHVLVGVTSSVIALPSFQRELIDSERDAWSALRTSYVDQLRVLFRDLPRDRKFILFCHDPTALGYLAEIEEVQARLPQLECTIIGHLHTRLILRTSRFLAGMPTLGFLGQTVKRLSGALSKARRWKPFRVVLCPSPAGIQLLKDGGYLQLDLGRTPADSCAVRAHRLPWR